VLRGSNPYTPTETIETAKPQNVKLQNVKVLETGHLVLTFAVLLFYILLIISDCGDRKNIPFAPFKVG
jgi:hypothetical protein